MKIIFLNMINKIKNNFKLKVIKGYKILNKKNKKFEVEKFKDEISSQIIQEISGKNEIHLRQFLLRYLMNFRFNAIYFKAVFDKGLLIYPLPKAWSKKLKSNGFKINITLNILLLYFLSLFFFFKSIITFLSLLFYNNKKFLFENYISFNNLTPDTLPVDKKDTYDIFNWYRNEYNKDVNFLIDFKFKKNEITEHFKINSSRVIFPPLNFFGKLIFFFKFFKHIFLSFFYVLIFNWENLILSEEKIKKNYVEELNENKLAKEYWFSISDFIFRPLWTYVIEGKCKIILFNYASSFLGHKINGIYPPEEVGIKSMNWPYIYQWSDKYLKFFKEKINKSSSLELVSPIWYSDKKINLIVDKKKLSVSVFDVAPSSFMRSIYLNANVYRSNFCAKKFLIDIASLVDDYTNIEIFFKTKRVLNSKYHSKTYINLIKKLKTKERLNFIDGNCSPYRIIKSTDLSISIPFTSTALIGMYMKKPSCFYDPLNILDEDDRACQNLLLIKEKINLQKWVKRYV